MNARISLSPTEAGREIALWGANRADEHYVIYINDLTGGDAASGLGAMLTTTGYPRTYGIDLRYRWR